MREGIRPDQGGGLYCSRLWKREKARVSIAGSRSEGDETERDSKRERERASYCIPESEMEGLLQQL